MEQNIFLGSRYRATWRREEDYPTVIVGFQSRPAALMHAGADFPPPFISARVQPADISAHIVNLHAKSSDWYLQSEVYQACQAIREQFPRHRMIAYGSSMGGYAALNMAEALNADQVIALSPLSTIFGPYCDKIGDRRYASDRPGLDQSMDKIRTGAMMRREGLLFFDPLHALDTAHAAHIAALTRMTLVAVPGAGHGPGQVIESIVPLKSILKQFIEQTLDLDALRLKLAGTEKTSKSDDDWLNAFLIAAKKASPSVEDMHAISQRVLTDLPMDRDDLIEPLRALLAILKVPAKGWTEQTARRNGALRRVCVALRRRRDRAWVETFAQQELPPEIAKEFAFSQP